jgi:hypothetical protein
MHQIAVAAQPITGRGVGYKLFAAGLIASMDRSEMQRVYRLLKEAREHEMIPWDWIVDETTRELEGVSSWKNPQAFTRTVIKAYRRDYWNQQPVRIDVWSEKGTVRGVLRPVLDEYKCARAGFADTVDLTGSIDAMRCGQARHFQNGLDGAVWWLSKDGQRISDEVVQLIIKNPTVAGVGDALPFNTDVPAQVWRYVE